MTQKKKVYGELAWNIEYVQVLTSLLIPVQTNLEVIKCDACTPGNVMKFLEYGMAIFMSFVLPGKDIISMS